MHTGGTPITHGLCSWRELDGDESPAFRVARAGARADVVAFEGHRCRWMEWHAAITPGSRW
jgi:hypothetical protein